MIHLWDCLNALGYRSCLQEPGRTGSWRARIAERALNLGVRSWPRSHRDKSYKFQNLEARFHLGRRMPDTTSAVRIVCIEIDVGKGS
jgi:hypothetical protein